MQQEPGGCLSFFVYAVTGLMVASRIAAAFAV